MSVRDYMLQAFQAMNDPEIRRRIEEHVEFAQKYQHCPSFADLRNLCDEKNVNELRWVLNEYHNRNDIYVLKYAIQTHNIEAIKTVLDAKCVNLWKHDRNWEYTYDCPCACPPEIESGALYWAADTCNLDVIRLIIEEIDLRDRDIAQGIESPEYITNDHVYYQSIDYILLTESMIQKNQPQIVEYLLGVLKNRCTVKMSLDKLYPHRCDYIESVEYCYNYFNDVCTQLLELDMDPKMRELISGWLE